MKRYIVEEREGELCLEYRVNGGDWYLSIDAAIDEIDKSFPLEMLEDLHYLYMEHGSITEFWDDFDFFEKKWRRK